jgi:hypothetical protein
LGVGGILGGEGLAGKGVFTVDFDGAEVDEAPWGLIGKNWEKRFRSAMKSLTSSTLRLLFTSTARTCP